MTEQPFLTPHEALTVAFGRRDFRSGDQTFSVQTSDIRTDRDTAFVDVAVTDRLMDNTVSYRYRVECDGPVD